jgi:hypothetical protein
MQKTVQFIGLQFSSVNGMSQTYKTASIFFYLTRGVVFRPEWTKAYESPLRGNLFYKNDHRSRDQLFETQYS